MIRLIGVDVATRLGRTGLAAGTWDGARVRVEVVLDGASLGPRDAAPAETARRVGAWIAAQIQPDQDAVIGLDAPLGWPLPLSRALAGHRAGQPLDEPVDPHRLWRRLTDQEVHQTTGKLPLEVGADRIARCAAVALAILREARARSQVPLPLPMIPPPWRGPVVVEVYPAALRRAWGLPSGTDEAILLDVVGPTPDGRRLPVAVRAADHPAILTSEHTFDAVLALFAAADAATGRARAPSTEHASIVEAEGWIWSMGAPPDRPSTRRPAR